LSPKHQEKLREKLSELATSVKEKEAPEEFNEEGVDCLIFRLRLKVPVKVEMA
jgi:hypothetical protein